MEHTAMGAHTSTNASNAGDITPFFVAKATAQAQGRDEVLTQPQRIRKPTPLPATEHPVERTLQTVLPTPINIDRFSVYLSGYDPTVVNTLISGFTYGFKINFQGKCHNSISNNLLSAFNNPTVVDLKLSKELEAGRIAGPFDTQPFDNIRVSLLGVIPNKTPGEFRMIHNLSFPRGKSINDFIPDEFSSVKYATVDDAIRIIKHFGVGCAMAKTDVRNAFRIIPIHPSDFPLLGFQWRNFSECVHFWMNVFTLSLDVCTKMLFQRAYERPRLQIFTLPRYYIVRQLLGY